MKVLKKYKQIIMVLLYGIFYILCFAYLEQGRGGMVYHIIHTRLDDMLPFCEFFIVPYFLWFFYVGITVFYVTCIRKEGFRKFAFSLVFGTLVFILISAVYPNMQDLRPEVFERDNIFVDLVRMLYKTDTPTNVLPSLHVYMSMITNMAICDETAFKKNRAVCWSSQILCILIVLSTMFLKQHSVIDVCMGIIMAYMLYDWFYNPAETMDKVWTAKWNSSRIE